MEGNEEKEEKNLDNEKNIESFNYNYIDPLTAIGFHADSNDIYYMNPPKELNTYPMYIENPKKIENKFTSYISFSLNGTNITDKMSRRYSDFHALYEKLLQRWPGVYIPRIPEKKANKTTSKEIIKNRMRLLNYFLINLSNIDYLYSCEETILFKGKSPDLANAISKLPELSIEDLLNRLKNAFPQYNENYDILLGKGKINEFEVFLKKTLKNIEAFLKKVEISAEKREQDKKSYVELINGFADYEKKTVLVYSDEDENCSIFNNPKYKELAEKINKIKDELINPYTAFKDWLEEEILDTEAMLIAIKGINELLEKQEKLKQKLMGIETELKKLESGGGGFKTFFKKKEDVLAGKNKEKEETQEKINNMTLIIKIVAENLENQIINFKNMRKTKYYKYLKIYAILQRESTKVSRELWTLVKTALNAIAPQSSQPIEDFITKPISSEQNVEEDLDD